MNKQILLFGAVALLFGCKKYDIEPPTVNEFNIEGQTSNIVLDAGGRYSLFYQVEDNQEVDRIDIRVRKGFEFENDFETTSNDFFFSDGRSYDQKAKSEGIAFNPPGGVAAGSYRVGILASDPNNNLTLERFLDFVLVNGRQPAMDVVIESTFEAKSPNVRARRGDRLMFKGLVNAQRDIKKLKFAFFNNDRMLFSKSYDLPGASDLQLDMDQWSDSLDFIISPETVFGDYRFTVSATDNEGQTGVSVFNVKIPY
jgi:hypothetical protein